MTALSSPSFQHRALFYESADGFLAAAVPFVRAGLEANEPVLVATEPAKAAMLRAALGRRAEAVEFADMTEAGRNPARIIPMWERFLADRGRPHGPARGIGEPVWPGRGPAEVVEAQVHEALVNVAFAGEGGFSLMCPYDVRRLDPSVVREAQCSHPEVVEPGGEGPSASYLSGEAALARLAVPLPPPAATPEVLAFDRRMLYEVRAFVTRRAAQEGMPAARVHDFVLAVNEVAANSIRHGGGNGVARLWEEDGVLVCEIRDRGHIRDPLAGRRMPGAGQMGGWGLWTAHQVADLVQVRSGVDGTTVRLQMAVA